MLAQVESFCACRCEYLFNFDNTFEIHDDIEVLKRMGMSLGLENGSCAAEGLSLARSLVPKSLQCYVTGQRPGRGKWGGIWNFSIYLVVVVK